METIIEISQGVKCTKLPIAAINKIKKDLTFNNPEYITAMKRGSFIPADMPAKLVLYDEDEANQVCWIPRGYIFYLLKFLRSKKHSFKVKDCTLLLKPLELKFLKKLRDYQEIAHNQMMKYPIGVLVGGTGSGKTCVGISLIVSRQQPSLVIVHSKDLLYQWQDEIKFFTGEDCGLIGDGNFSIKPITVGIINSVSNKLNQLYNEFGHIIVDEVHKCAAKTWADILQEFYAKHYLGLTATPYRNDGLGNAIFASIGPKVHEINKKMLYDTKAILRPDIYRIQTDFKYLFLDDYSTMIKELTQNERRNRLICSEIARDLKKHNENIVVVSDRKNHCVAMQEMLLKEFGIKGEVLTGTKKKKERKDLTAKIKAGLCRVVFATVSLIGEGFDAPNLTGLFLTTPIKFGGRVVQVCGRVLRYVLGKTPRIYDFRDDNIRVLQYSGWQRDKIYKKEWG